MASLQAGWLWWIQAPEKDGILSGHHPKNV